MAAGLTIKTDNISQFQRNFENVVRKMTTPDDFLQTVLIDYELDFSEISGELIDELESLEPYGEGNPEPLFMTRNVKVSSSKIVGGNHRRMTLKQVSGKTARPVNAIQFNIDTDAPLREHFHQIAFRLRWNRWNGRQTAQIIIEET
ncbi:single-stranded-DNA-specific exonuclease RecJ, partial [Desulfobacterales bacterium HSG2]|nr:single-stranded-DNA-specific exonuclease RecJ [Desulfobacterales bacterium HSG2]